MGYKKAMSVLPNDLLMAIQKYVDGEYIYIPRKAGNKKQWGERKNSRYQLDQRNHAIFEQYQCGISVEALARQYYLSPKTIYKILSGVIVCCKK
jgi:Mor family transcriptional regulator